MKHRLLLLAVPIAIASASTVLAQEFTLPLYSGAIPNSRPTASAEQVDRQDVTRISAVQIPAIAVYLPTPRTATGQAVVICPGGSYARLAYDLEGSDIARYFNSIGVAGVVLKYRLPSAENSVEPHRTPLLDAKRAMRLVRANASRWHIDPAAIGIMGFSAGGHLAATLGTHFDDGDKAAADEIERQSSRPDFMILMYPVISFRDGVAHAGSRRALLGDAPSRELLDYYSAELQVSGGTPPAFLVHAVDDAAVPLENTLLMYQALRARHIPAELHILSEGGHGFGLALGNPHVASWTASLRLWLQALKPQK